MKPFAHPKDSEFVGIQGAQVRRVGKKRRTPAWKLAAVAKGAPHELDALPEDPISRTIEGEIQASGLPYLRLEDADLGWLKRQAPKDYHAARLLDALKDLPDFTVWRPAPGCPYAISLPLELKRTGRGGRPGQRAFAEAAGGLITRGYTESHDALERFLRAPLPPTPKEN